MLILVDIYNVDTNIYSLHFVVNIIVIKRLTKINKVTKAFVLTKFNNILKVTDRCLNIDRQIDSYIHT